MRKRSIEITASHAASVRTMRTEKMTRDVVAGACRSSGRFDATVHRSHDCGATMVAAPRRRGYKSADVCDG